VLIATELQHAMIERKSHRYHFALICPIPELTTAISQGLQQQELEFDQSAAVAVLLDTPSGFALNALEHGYAAGRRLVVLTWNPCPEYWDDLWDFQIDVLIAGSCSMSTLACAVAEAAEGHSVRLPPRSMTSLTVVERRLLSFLARGYANQEIATRLALSHQTVRNSLTTIYEKLHVKSRSEAILYYWGMGSLTGAEASPPELSHPRTIRAN
jgi:DNA-binding NarL/FixJ family response regulator